eukprot:g38478.t1
MQASPSTTIEQLQGSLAKLLEKKEISLGNFGLGTSQTVPLKPEVTVGEIWMQSDPAPKLLFYIPQLAKPHLRTRSFSFTRGTTFGGLAPQTGRSATVGSLLATASKHLLTDNEVTSREGRRDQKAGEPPGREITGRGGGAGAGGPPGPGAARGPMEQSGPGGPLARRKEKEKQKQRRWSTSAIRGSPTGLASRLWPRQASDKDKDNKDKAKDNKDQEQGHREEIVALVLKPQDMRSSSDASGSVFEEGNEAATVSEISGRAPRKTKSFILLETRSEHSDPGEELVGEADTSRDHSRRNSLHDASRIHSRHNSVRDLSTNNSPKNADSGHSEPTLLPD